MPTLTPPLVSLSLEQQRIRARCYHPSGTFVPFPEEAIERSVPARFEHIVGQYAPRPAIKTQDHVLTYDALNKAANRIAHAILERRGAASEAVAVLFEHGAPLIAAILGVLKAGKTYVPLDPLNPEARSAYILADTQPGLLVTNSPNLALSRTLARDTFGVLNVDDIADNVSTANPGLSIRPETLFWIQYTSGSTGQPKGVMQNHRNILHVIMNHTNDCHVCPEDRLTLLYSASFNASGKDIFGALLTGATLLPFDVKQEGVGNLADWLIAEDITLYNSITTVFRHFVATLTQPRAFPALRLVQLGSEPMLPTDVELYRTHFSSACILLNKIGGTEAQTFCQYFLDKDTVVTTGSVPVGYPVPGKELWLCDTAGHRVAPGQIGEIVVQSRYMSPGYWRRSDLTQAAFRPAPGGTDKRLYHTGDIGMLQSDGCLVHMGRKDFQVKIRGHRVEIEEIEAVLLTLKSIKEAAVVTRGQAGHQILAAYLVPAEHSVPSVTALRHTLSEKLPQPLVPSVFVMLNALPRTLNGKVDRNMLPALDEARPTRDTQFVAPRTPVEVELARIWTDVLQCEPVGINDPFLELGGHSLLATQILVRIVETLRVELPLRTLLDAPTVADLAVVITQYQAAQADPGVVARLLAEVEGL